MKKKFPEEKYKFIRYFIAMLEIIIGEYALKGVDYAVHPAH